MIYNADSRLSAETQAIMDAQTAVKQEVKRLYMRGVGLAFILARVSKLIQPYLDEIKDEYLKKETQKSLEALARRTFATMSNSQSFGNLTLLLAVVAIYNGTARGTALKAAEKVVMNAPPQLFGKTVNWQTYKIPYGTQVQQRVLYYMRDVTRTVQQLAGLKAENESEGEFVQRKNSMRATAEMIVRENNHQKSLAEKRARGVKLVIISTHADCSNRCAPFQGRVFSLDGSTGTTPDGRKYEPLENATEIYYTTKAGKVWRNGLFGFGCRHEDFEYRDGLQPPSIDEKQRKREVAIDQMQRAYERQIIRAREQAIALKDIDNAKYAQWKQYSQKLFKEYAEYSHKNGRHYYTSRIRIL